MKQTFETNTYQISCHGKLKQEIRLAFLSDLHSERYGEALIRSIRGFQPDAVLFGGDTFDERVSWDAAIDTLRACASEWQTFYTPGNHEQETFQIDKVKQAARETGTRVLAGESVLLSIRNDKLLLCGVEDPRRDEPAHQKQMTEARAAAKNHPNVTILLTHRPERVEEYQDGVFDLVLTGHAHGGQWRFPFLKNGLIAPDVGLFPKYTGGLYRLGRTQMVVSRGLARHNTRVPRIGNKPELVFLVLLP